MAYLLSQLLTQSTQAVPNRLAVVDGKNHLTYCALDELSNRFAHLLRQAGVIRGDRVGLYLEKSLAAVAAIFGVLKIGAAYVPLDPAAPIQRIAYMVENCQMKALVSTTQKMRAFQKAAPNGSPATVLVDDQQAFASASADPPPDPHSIENDLAYILYTSGSTGTPKGVMISHRASLTFVNWAYETFQVLTSDRVSSHAPFHFDLSIFDLFTTIKAGGTVILVPAALSVFPINLANFIAEQKISIWYSVPSALTRLVLYGRLEKHAFPHLRTVLFAGEVFPIKYLRQLMTQIPDARYYNLYGPTETNVCTYYEVPTLSPERVAPLPIGQACANSDVFVLNTQNEVVAGGEVGELCVRGPSLMTGYWGLPKKSAQVRHPYILTEGLGAQMIYRTGDLVKQAPDGNYLYLGRRDNMIKSRGYRIELGEIETVLYSHPADEEAAVIPIPDEQIGNRIHAFLAIQHGEERSRGIFDAFCAKRLPKYMLPHDISFRETLPKTSTGKIDKTRLSQEMAR